MNSPPPAAFDFRTLEPNKPHEITKVYDSLRETSDGKQFYTRVVWNGTEYNMFLRPTNQNHTVLINFLNKVGAGEVFYLTVIDKDGELQYAIGKEPVTRISLTNTHRIQIIAASIAAKQKNTDIPTEYKKIREMKLSEDDSVFLLGELIAYGEHNDFTFDLIKDSIL